MVGVGDVDRDVVCLYNRHGIVSERLDLGLGCRDDPVRAPRTGGRSHAAHCRVLPGLANFDVHHGLGLGRRRVGRYEIL